MNKLRLSETSPKLTVKKLENASGLVGNKYFLNFFQPFYSELIVLIFETMNLMLFFVCRLLGVTPRKLSNF